MANFFRNNMGAITLEDLGINLATMDEDELERIMNSIYTPTASDNAMLALPPGTSASTIQNNVDTKASFGVCPHVAFKFGYFYPELKACLYAKVGMIQLNGRVAPVNDVYGLRDEKFNKIAPFVAVGGMKNIDDHWGIAFEISHAFKTTKKLQDVKIFRHTMENRTSVSRTNFRVMVQYRL